MSLKDADVIVVGGGPGGSTTATLLAKAGHEVILLEREHHPRHQIGESLLPSTIHGVCRMLDVLDEVHAAGFTVKRGGTFRWGRRGEPWTFTFNSTTLASADYSYQVERAKFDAILFDNARRHGVDCREGAEVLELTEAEPGLRAVRVRNESGDTTELRARFLVDASGNGSRLTRHVGTKVYSDFFRNVAVYGYFHNAARRPAPNEGNIVTSAFAQGWCWFIPLTPELTSVGAVVDRQHAAAIGADREAALWGFVRECPIVNDLLADAERVREGMYGEVRVRKDWSYLTDRLTAPGMLLVGDAACFVDPVFSSGVHLATYGGVLAARTIATILAGDIDEETCRGEFEQRYQREFRVWYEFLLGFFDMQQDWDDHFWNARRILNTEERANEAFINLIAGAGSASEEFFAARSGLGSEFERLVESVADLGDGVAPANAKPEGSDATRLLDQRVHEGRDLLQPTGVPLFEDGLIPTPDGLRWMQPDREPVASA